MEEKKPLEDKVYVNAYVENGIGKKSGTPYTRVTIELTPSLKKDVFLENAEKEAYNSYLELEKLKSARK